MQHWDPKQTAFAVSPHPQLFGKLVTGILKSLGCFVAFYSASAFLYLILVDVQDPFQWQLLKVQSVTLIKIRAHCLWVAIHDHGLVAKLTQRADTGDSTPIKLHTAACQETERKGRMQRKNINRYSQHSSLKKKKKKISQRCLLSAQSQKCNCPPVEINHPQNVMLQAQQVSWLSCSGVTDLSNMSVTLCS